jgi:hypothetical protein
LDLSPFNEKNPQENRRNFHPTSSHGGREGKAPSQIALFFSSYAVIGGIDRIEILAVHLLLCPTKRIGKISLSNKRHFSLVP